MSPTTTEDWPALPYEEWAPTKKTLQMCAQMLGKVRLALAPPQPEWLHACLFLEPRGFTTGAMPWGALLVTLGIDVFDSTIRIDVSDGRRRVVPLDSGRCVAEVWEGLRTVLGELGMHPDVWEKPQELADVTPFSENRHDCTLDAAHAQRFLQVLAAVQGAFEEFRSPFFGRSGVQFWWGAFDLAVLLFSGKHNDAPRDQGYIMRHDLDAEHFNAGFWPGDDTAPEPGFYAYIVPRPPDCASAPVQPETAGWVESMGEWMLPYESVRSCPDPHKAILDFLTSVYTVAVTNGGWDALDHRYTPPAPVVRDR
jgi:hypothetical protein